MHEHIFLPHLWLEKKQAIQEEGSMGLLFVETRHQPGTFSSKSKI